MFKVSKKIIIRGAIGNALEMYDYALLFSMTPVFITEIVPLSIRCSYVGLIYSLATCLGGGITPLLALFFSHHIQINYSPGFVLFFPGTLSLIALYYHKISVKIAEIS